MGEMAGYMLNGDDCARCGPPWASRGDGGSRVLVRSADHFQREMPGVYEERLVNPTTPATRAEVASVGTARIVSSEGPRPGVVRAVVELRR